MTETDAVFSWLANRDFAGFDPYDGLTSPLISRGPLGASRAIRLAWIQFFKRNPLNLRRLVGIRPQTNPKTIGLVLTGLSYRPASIAELRQLADSLIARLREMRSKNSTGWGYPFAWQNRHFYAPANTPNAVCTTFVTNGLLDYADAADVSAARELAGEAAEFLLDELPHADVRDGIAFRYTPLDTSVVHNVNLLVAACLARLHASGLAGPRALDLAMRAARASIAAQHFDGSWSYGESAVQRWVDSFHTGYNLVALQQLEAITGDTAVARARRLGYEYFRARCVDADGAIRYFDVSRFPLDTHSAAQAIVTFLRAQDMDDDALRMSQRVRTRMLQLLRKGPGEYAYRRARWWTNGIVYARWTQAWVFRALAELDSHIAPLPSQAFGSTIKG